MLDDAERGMEKDRDVQRAWRGPRTRAARGRWVVRAKMDPSVRAIYEPHFISQVFHFAVQEDENVKNWICFEYWGRRLLLLGEAHRDVPQKLVRDLALLPRG
eukprot:10507768-Heterocapsa_arctica.AAC.1